MEPGSCGQVGGGWRSRAGRSHRQTVLKCSKWSAGAATTVICPGKEGHTAGLVGNQRTLRGTMRGVPAVSTVGHDTSARDGVTYEEGYTVVRAKDLSRASPGPARQIRVRVCVRKREREK